MTTAPNRRENADMAAGAATPASGHAPRGAAVYGLSLASLAWMR
ncbi:MAG TPA: hypothetical protein VFS33_03265 [Gemmatimonadales bacterium]|nr:hypothetical protein [Gemmatimonadales bacterium]